MAATDSIMYPPGTKLEMVEAAISELDYETMARLPNPDSNSISWILGHISRVTDMFIMHRLSVQDGTVVRRWLVREVGLTDNVEGLAGASTWPFGSPPPKSADRLLRGGESHHPGIRAVAV